MKLSISQVVAEIESAGVYYVMRYEPKFATSAVARGNCVRGHRPGYMNNSTAGMICQTSWGLYQIMGENIYTICGYRGPINVFVEDWETQQRCFETFLDKRGINYTLDEILNDPIKGRKFSLRYNGAATAYYAKIKETAKRLGA